MENSPCFTRQSYAKALEVLASEDADLSGILERHGPPKFWTRKPGFPALLQIILEQQVSLASGKATYDRLLAATGELSPQSFLALDDDALRSVGFSRQKTAYCRGLAAAVVSGESNLTRLARLNDDEARETLTRLKGIGRWTADIYLMMALKRADIWPVGDLALVTATQQFKRLRKRPTPEKLLKIGETWRPYRSAAARILWLGYLRERSGR